MSTKKIKTLLINPPISSFHSIYAAIPILMGQLEKNNIDVNVLDMNIEFFKEITSPKYLKKQKKSL